MHFGDPAHHLLKVDGANPPRLLLHLVHALLSQVEVGLQVVSHHGEPQRAHQHDDPQPQGVERLLAHPAAEMEGGGMGGKRREGGGGGAGRGAV